ncbi:ABC transporter substrate-binding protein [Ruminiclostridium cellobioparum]|jgi:ABC-type sugar transport system substrate-binding protein|uniref:ABC transporter substrate-binding protein n=1 Tax=Ruminiclostridium cellobioparum TaxID=29355 RepID=UPI0028AF5B7F|nr:ABC transporter substrate-binding protein [Ruminiclostridium cellobioparum]
MKMRKMLAVIMAAVVSLSIGACGADSSGSGSSNAAPSGTAAASNNSEKKIVLGFAQVGAESGWRTANTTSIQESAKGAGIDLKFSDAQQKQENQISAIRSYIAQKVDVIAFSPVVETGWDAVLQEAKDAGIPVVLTDRAVKMEGGKKAEDYYVTFLGSDFRLEGERAAQYLLDNASKLFPGKKEISIYELEGTVGSAPAIDRKEGFDKKIVTSTDVKFNIVKSQSGNFTRAEGQQVAESWLKSDADKMDVLFCHNDDMGLGAIQAIEAAGKKPGKDIIIVGIDGVKGAFEAMAAGKYNCSVECNPLIGPQLMDIVRKIMDGKTADIPKRIESEEGVFTQEQAAAELPNRKY